MYDILEADSEVEGSDKQIVDVMNKIDDSMDRYSNLFDQYVGNILTSIKKAHVNVLDLSQVDESVASVLVSHILRNSQSFCMKNTSIKRFTRQRAWFFRRLRLI